MLLRAIGCFFWNNATRFVLGQIWFCQAPPGPNMCALPDLCSGSDCWHLCGTLHNLTSVRDDVTQDIHIVWRHMTSHASICSGVCAQERTGAPPRTYGSRRTGVDNSDGPAILRKLEAIFIGISLAPRRIIESPFSARETYYTDRSPRDWSWLRTYVRSWAHTPLQALTCDVMWRHVTYEIWVT